MLNILLSFFGNLITNLEEIKWFNIELIEVSDFVELIVRFLFNMAMILYIVRYLYYRTTKRKDYLITYILIGTIIFLLCFLLENVNLDTGFALGLFAIFGIIRYRTNPIPIKEMTYLFVVIGISVVNGLANKKVSYAELVFTNLIIVAITYGLERIWLLKHESRKVIIYEKIDLIKPEKYQELKADLEERTGLTINRIEVGNVDFMRDTAKVRIYYYESDNQVNLFSEDQDSYDNE